MQSVQVADDDEDAASMTETVGSTHAECACEFVFKVVVVGDYNVGKTTLIQALLATPMTQGFAMGTRARALRQEQVLCQARGKPMRAGDAKESEAVAASLSCVADLSSINCRANEKPVVQRSTRVSSDAGKSMSTPGKTMANVNVITDSLNDRSVKNMEASNADNNSMSKCAEVENNDTISEDECSAMDEVGDVDVLSSVTPTIGTDFYARVLPRIVRQQSIRLQIWDTAGLSHFAASGEAIFRSASLIVCVFDVTNQASLQSLLTRHLASAAEYIPDLAQQNIVVVANKMDLLQISERVAAVANYWRSQHPEAAFLAVPVESARRGLSVASRQSKYSKHRGQEEQQEGHAQTHAHKSIKDNKEYSMSNDTAHDNDDEETYADVAMLCHDHSVLSAIASSVVTQADVKAVLGCDFDEVNYCEVSSRRRTGINALLQCICHALLRSVGVYEDDKEEQADAKRHSSTARTGRRRRHAVSASQNKCAGVKDELEANENVDDSVHGVDTYALLAHSQLPLHSTASVAQVVSASPFACSSSNTPFANPPMDSLQEQEQQQRATNDDCARNNLNNMTSTSGGDSWQNKGISFDMHADPCHTVDSATLASEADYSPAESSQTRARVSPGPGDSALTSSRGPRGGVLSSALCMPDSGNAVCSISTENNKYAGVCTKDTDVAYTSHSDGAANIDSHLIAEHTYSPPCQPVDVERRVEQDVDGLHLRQYIQSRFTEIDQSHREQQLPVNESNPEQKCLRAPQPVDVAAQYRKEKRKNKIKQICKCT